jgi:hypothetical protein
LRDCIDRILKGQFEYDRGELSFSFPHLELNIQEGEEIEGSFTITGPSEKMSEGTVSSTEIRMEVLTDSFSGEKSEVSYRFRGEGLSGGDVIKGHFRIVSNRGEYMLPFSVTVEQPKISSSLGDIRNLFHFTNLARSSWDEALHLFYSNQFHYIFKGNDAQYESLYRGLAKENMSQHNMDEFLVAINKKHPVTIECDVKSFEEEAPKETVDRSIILTKGGWGYAHLKVDFEGDFLTGEKSYLTDDDFLGSKAYLHFQIDPQFLHSGHNYGCIKIYNEYTRIDIPVTVSTVDYDEELHKSYIRKKRLTHELLRSYLAFRGRRVSSRQWMADTGKLISRMFTEDPDDIEFKLYGAHFLITAGRLGQGQYILEQIMPEIDRLAHLGTEYGQQTYCYYLYLQTLISREESDIQKATELIEEVFKRHPENWRIAWILGYVSDEYSLNPQNKWLLLQSQYERGCNSPIVYMDAFTILKNKPELFLRIDDFTISVLEFAADQGILTIPVMEQVTYLSGNVRNYDKRLYKILKACYESQESDEALLSLCSLLMKGERCDKDSYIWYKKGATKQLRLTRLYEYYMMSLPEDEDGRAIDDIPRVVLMYFSYQSNLPWTKNAVLYRYIYEHMDDYPELYESYRFQIEKFLVAEIEKKHINPALGWLYEHVVTAQMIDAQNAQKFLAILYTCRIVVEDPDIREVIVIYDKCRSQMHYDVVNRVCNLPLYGSEYTILLADANGDRHAASAPYSITKLMNPRDLLSLTTPYIQSGTENLDQFLCELGRSAYTITLENASRYRDLADSDVIREDVRAQIRSDLIRFYYENDFMRQLSEYLNIIEPEKLTQRQRGEMLELMVLTGMFDKAVKWLRRYGCYNIDPKIIMRLCGRAFDSQKDLGDSVLTEIAWYAFHLGKYDEPTLLFLCNSFQGTIREMRDLFKASESYGMENRDLIERILVQMLYTGSYLGDHVDIYRNYVRTGTYLDLEIAYLSQCSYDYMVRDKVTEPYIYSRIETLYKNGVILPLVAMMAYLKFFAYSDPMDKEIAAKSFGTARKETGISRNNDICKAFLKTLMSRDLYFEFFKNYIGLSPLMHTFADRMILEYHTRPHIRCRVHYMLITEADTEDTGEYQVRDLKEMYDGIYAASFILFYGEQLQYYITEEPEQRLDENGHIKPQKLTESGVLSIADESFSEGARKGVYGLINDVMMSEALNDDKAQFKLASDYYKNKFLVEEFFKPV